MLLAGLSGCIKMLSLQIGVLFKRALELHFGPFSYENHLAELFKLGHYGFVIDYQTNLENLKSNFWVTSRCYS